MTSLLTLLGVTYFMALGFGVMIRGSTGVTYVNRIFRKIIAWPIGMLGKALLELAKLIRR